MKLKDRVLTWVVMIAMLLICVVIGMHFNINNTLLAVIELVVIIFSGTTALLCCAALEYDG